MSSIFLDKPRSEWVACSALAFAIRDGFPVSPGHTLVIPRRVVPTWMEATPEERSAVMALVDQVIADLDRSHAPDGYNIGFNAGAAAGQTVMHLHVHVIPRYTGDVEDPRGGVRHVIPERGNYLAQRAPPLATGGTSDPFSAHLRPLFRRAQEIVIVAAFVQDSGLDVLHDSLFAALERGARARILAGDYLHITQARALQRLLDWTREWSARQEEGASGIFEGRVIQVRALDASTFHPKSWRFEGPDFGVAFVGSSNLSRAALETGVEWNLRVERGRDQGAYRAVAGAFEALWDQAQVLEQGWISRYREAARRQERPPDPEVEPPEPPQPHDVQLEALVALNDSRAAGQQRALVVMATGLGKTFLAAFDVRAFAESLGREPRVLFVAHRAEILAQAAETFRRLSPDTSFGWFVGGREELKGDLVLASVQKLSRPKHLAALSRQHFDYVIIDEVHHAAAESYRRVLAQLSPHFLLGLTATPERADAGDVLGLFDDHLPFRADLGAGIRRGFLVPFRYHGLKDPTDFVPIPWRSGRFSTAELSEALATQARMETLWAAWETHPGSRTLVFCCSIQHAEFAKRWLADKGVRVASVHTGPGAADRAEALEALERGALDAVTAVDLLNEGVDIKPVDRVVMLRPTESPVLFLQQLGRGLRTSAGKAALVVLDFVGNHRIFLDRARTLLALSASAVPLRSWLEGRAEAALPEGCSVEIALEAIELLKALLPQAHSNAAIRAYREIRAERGARPTAGELHRRGWSPRSVRHPEGWFGFVADEGDLGAAEQEAAAVGGAWLRDLETTAMSKCFKMVVLQVLLEQERLETGMPIEALSSRCLDWLRRSPGLLADLDGVKALGDLETLDARTWRRYWVSNPLKAWGNSGWFKRDREHFLPSLPRPASAPAREALVRMTGELVDLRLAQYRSRRQPGALGAAFTARVTWNQRDPILGLPSRDARPDLPQGETAVRLADGSVWSFRFVKYFCNVARPAGTQGNQLPALLRRWFGDGAGEPGTRDAVRFSPHPEGWWVAPATPARGLPAVGDTLDDGDVSRAFGVSRAPAAEVDRVDGVLFLRIAERGRFVSPERLEVAVADRDERERAQVLAGGATGGWRYCGEAGWDGTAWVLPALDFATWRRWGAGRGASRALEEEWLEAAEGFAATLLETFGEGGALEVGGRRLRLLGRSARGGVKIDGGPDGFKARSVSKMDLAWVLKTRAALPASGVLDEAAVNRARYLEGTPRASTRWIDTGHAIRLVQALASG